jgi:pimeloyl-ACP methyl ester carboxylesterase
VAVLDAVAKGRVRGADPGHVGLFGISVGGPVALAAATRFREQGGQGLRALCLVGAPDDMRRAARAWFAEAVAPSGVTGPALDRSLAGEFARSMVLRAAVPLLVADAGDRTVLRAWLAASWTPAGSPQGLTTKDGLSFLARAARPAPLPADDVEAILDAAWPVLVPLSPAHSAYDLKALTDLPVFLLHGVHDPLVSVEELPHLAARLRGAARVRTLRSYLVGHTDLTEEDRWENLLFLDAFFDAIEGS